MWSVRSQRKFYFQILWTIDLIEKRSYFDSVLGLDYTVRIGKFDTIL